MACVEVSPEKNACNTPSEKRVFSKMKPTSSLRASLFATALITSAASGQIVLKFTNAKDFLQTGPSYFQTEFRRGLLNINVRDGSVVTEWCDGEDGIDQWVPAGVIWCPLGTTAYIAKGDSNNDGILDSARFWSVSNLAGAALIEPFNEDLVGVIAAPPSQLIRPYSNFNDQSWLIFYNMLGAEIYQYVLTEYDSDRAYPAGQFGWERMDKEVVEGQYVFTLPLLNNPSRPVNLAVNHRVIPEGAGPHHRYPKNDFYFTSGTWDSEGFYLMDPYIGSKLEWTGNDVTNTYNSVDLWRFMIIDSLPLADPEAPLRTFAVQSYDQKTTYEAYLDQLLNSDGPIDLVGIDGQPTIYTARDDNDPYLPTVEFPPSRVPLVLPSAYAQSFTIPSGFFEPGSRKYIQLRVDRVLGTSSVAFDTAVRLFHAPIRFVSSYAGYSSVKFPNGADASLIAPSGDYDNDGASNISEMAAGTDPVDDGDAPVSLTPVQESDGTVTFTYDTGADVYLRHQLVITDTVTGEVMTVNDRSRGWEFSYSTRVELEQDPVEDREYSHTITTVTVKSKAIMSALDLTAEISGIPLTLK